MIMAILLPFFNDFGKIIFFILLENRIW
jgi:hypothetical protein